MVGVGWDLDESIKNKFLVQVSKEFPLEGE
jgi:hypothetical protein